MFIKMSSVNIWPGAVGKLWRSDPGQNPTQNEDIVRSSTSKPYPDTCPVPYNMKLPL